MKRKLLILSAFISFAFLSPATVYSSVLRNYAAGVMDFQESDISISFTQGTLTIIGGEGMILEIVSLTGRKVMEQPIESPAQKFELNIPKGCYIVKVGKVVRKVSIR